MEGAGNDFPVFSVSIGDLAGAEMISAAKRTTAAAADAPAVIKTEAPAAATGSAAKEGGAKIETKTMSAAAEAHLKEDGAPHTAQNTGFSADVPLKSERFPFGFPVPYFRIPVWVREENRPLYAFTAGEKAQKTALFVPYFAWANREESDMAVFFPEEGR